MRILVVEDDVVLAIVSVMALEEAGHDIVGPVHDLESFDQLSELRGIDLALVDVNLAGADEGIEVAQRLREQHRIPSLFVSGQLGAAREHRHLALGMLRKPYDIDDLLNSVAYVQNVLVDGPRAAAPQPAALEIFPS